MGMLGAWAEPVGPVWHRVDGTRRVYTREALTYSYMYNVGSYLRYTPY